ncbi:MAG: hypothetical protein H6815_12160 [Phycisphaeraceae bacterium]|nr:hypothetical protein [Phycisphaerales bacterium]MCB9861194.1 hypothetical protein [Phycisphaeraceae bacterium]
MSLPATRYDAHQSEREFADRNLRLSDHAIDGESGSVSQHPAQPTNPTDAAQAVAKARKQLKPIRRAIGWAGISGWSTLVFGILSALIGGAQYSAAGTAVGVGLIIAGSLELVGRSKLKALSVDAVKFLLLSQLALAITLVSYGGWKVYEVAVHGSPVAREIESQFGDAGAGADIGEIYVNMIEQFTYVAYFGVIAIGVIAPAWAAFIYYLKKPLLKRLNAEHPQWVLEALKS